MTDGEGGEDVDIIRKEKKKSKNTLG